MGASTVVLPLVLLRCASGAGTRQLAMERLSSGAAPLFFGLSLFMSAVATFLEQKRGDRASRDISDWSPSESRNGPYLSSAKRYLFLWRRFLAACLIFARAGYPRWELATNAIGSHGLARRWSCDRTALVRWQWFLAAATVGTGGTCLWIWFNFVVALLPWVMGFPECVLALGIPSWRTISSIWAEVWA